MRIIDILKQKKISFKIFSIISEHNIHKKNEILELLKNILDNKKQRHPLLSLARLDSCNAAVNTCKQNFCFLKNNPFNNLKNYIPSISELLSKRDSLSCLSKSLGMDCNKNIYACAEMHLDSTFIGNLENFNNVDDILTDKYMDIISQESVEEKCLLCEFRYFCHHCLVLFKNKNVYNMDSLCSYDPRQLK